MLERKTIKEMTAEDERVKQELRYRFKELLAAGEVNESRVVIKEAQENNIELNFAGEEYKAAAEKAVADSFRKGHVRHAARLLEFATDNKIIVDLSGDDMRNALSEGFEVCGPRKKEEILQFAKQNRIEIET